VASVSGLASRGKLQLERARARVGAVDIAVRTQKRFSEDDGGVHSAALTYYLFLSVFPILLFAASALGYLTFLSASARASLVTTGIDAFPLLSRLLDPASLGALQEQRGTLAIVGLLMALYSGTGGIVALKHALDHIDRTPDEGSFISKRLAALKWLAVLGSSALVSLALGTGAAYAGRLLDKWGPGAEALGFIIALATGLAVGIGLFIMTFRGLPQRSRTIREVLPGALMAAGLFEMLKLVGAWYLERGAQSREATFGAFAAAAGLLVASYLLAQIVLLSAELNEVLAERRQMRGSPTKERA
jgi:membrane protein